MNTFFSGLWKVAVWIPLLTLAAILAAQTLFTLDSRELWFSDEIRYANVFEHVVMAKKWLVMYLNGVPYPDKPPVYFWFMALFLPLFGGPVPALFFAAAAASGLLLLASTLLLARRVAGTEKDTALLAGLLLLTCFYFVGLTHYSRMDLLFAAFITVCHVCLFSALSREHAPVRACAGFLFAAVATLTKGPLGLIFPLLTCVVFLVWTGRPGRLVRRDMLWGFAGALLVLLAWVLGAWAMGEGELLSNVFYKQIYRRALDASHHKEPFWYYLVTFPLACLPWTFLIVLLPVHKIFTRSFWNTLWTSRNIPEGQGTIFLWIQFISGFILLCSLSTKIIVYLLPLFPPLALLTARTLTTLDRKKTQYLLFFPAGLFALLSLACLVFAMPFVDIPGLPVKPAGLLWLAVAGLLPVAFLFLVRRLLSSALAPMPALLLFSLLFSVWLYPAMRITAPSLDVIMSPKEQAQVMGAYISQGYVSAAYKIYSGVYSYYAGANIYETQDLELLADMAATEPRMILAMHKKNLETWLQYSSDFRIIHEQWIADRPYILLIKGPELPSGSTFAADKILPAFAGAPFAPPVQQQELSFVPVPGEPVREDEHVNTPRAVRAPRATRQDSPVPKLLAVPDQESSPVVPQQTAADDLQEQKTAVAPPAAAPEQSQQPEAVILPTP